MYPYQCIYTKQIYMYTCIHVYIYTAYQCTYINPTFMYTYILQLNRKLLDGVVQEIAGDERTQSLKIWKYIRSTSKYAHIYVCLSSTGSFPMAVYTCVPHDWHIHMCIYTCILRISVHIQVIYSLSLQLSVPVQIIQYQCTYKNHVLIYVYIYVSSTGIYTLASISVPVQIIQYQCTYTNHILIYTYILQLNRNLLDGVVSEVARGERTQSFRIYTYTRST